MGTFLCNPCGRSNLGFLLTLLLVLITAEAFGENTGRFKAEQSGTPDGRPIVLVPGLASSGDVWSQSLSVLSKYDTHVLTLAGFAGTPPPRTMDHIVGPAGEALANYLVDHDLNNVLLVGHSMGAQVAIVAARSSPERVSEILIVDSVPFFAGLLRPGADPIQVAAGRDGMVSQIAALPRDQFLAFMRQGLPRQSKSEIGQTQIMRWIELSDQQTVAHASGEVLTSDYSENLDQLSVPITVIVPHTPAIGITAEQVASVYGEQYDQVEDLELRVVPDSRHFVMFDQPDLFEQELLRFIQEATK